MLSNYKNRVALISGTGSNCIGILNNTTKAKVGGLGVLLSNQGSGYYIESLGLKTALKSVDGRGMETILVDKIYKKFGVDNFLQIKKIIQQSSNWQKEIASVARIVVKCAELGDKQAIKILDSATKQLILHINGINKLLYKHTEHFEIAVAGNVFKSKYVKQLFKLNVVKYNPNITKILYVRNPLYEGPLVYYKSIKPK